MAENEIDLLNEVAEQWTDEMANAGVAELKEGDAQFKVINAFTNRSTGGRIQDNWQVVCVSHDTSPQSVGRKGVLRYGLQKPQDIERLNTALKNLGFPIITAKKDQIVAEIQRIHKDVMGVCFNGKVVPNKDGGDFPPNIYINAGARRRDLEGVSAAPSGDTAAGPAKNPADRF